MQTYLTKLAPPTADKRWRIVDAMMRRHNLESQALIETLHTVQETFGCLDKDSLRYVASTLRAPLSQAYGVATFYHHFTMKPPGDHSCVVCLGTACYIKGAPQLLQIIQSEMGIRSGETTADGSLSLLTVRCLGSCGLAPAVVFDGAVGGKVEPTGVMETIRKGLQHDT